MRYSLADAQPTHGRTAMSLFAGCGGSSLGYRLAGYRILFANEFIAKAADAYEANKAEYTVLDKRDIRLVKPEEILNATGIDIGELDVLDGSPPCSSFSDVGNKAEGWGKAKDYSGRTQRTDDLFPEYARIAAALQPRHLVVENVVGLTRGVAKGHLLAFSDTLKQAGYRVRASILDAQFYGVPQSRKRMFLLATRNDIAYDITHPTPSKTRASIDDAWVWPKAPQHDRDMAADIEGLVDIEGPNEKITSSKPLIYTANYRSNGEAFPTSGPMPTITASGARDVTRERVVVTSSATTAICPESGRDLSGYGPLVTKQHPGLGLRQLSIPEVRLACGYPLDYELFGSYIQRWERLGRSVPPPLMRAIAEQIERDMR